MAHQRSESHPYHSPSLLGSPPGRPGRRAVSVAALGATLVAALLASATPATSAADSQCPAAYPARDIPGSGADLPVSGLTVRSGTKPVQFTGTVIGKLDDGILPGTDLIMARLQGAGITDAAGNVRDGIWAGMSGSPVYTEDGRLVGAVSYGFSLGLDNLAGITPARAMYDLLPGRGTTAARVAINPRQERRLVASGDLSPAESGGSFHRLRIPLGIAGVPWDAGARRLADAMGLSERAQRLGIELGGAAGAAASKAASIDIAAGGNVAASLSYGDITFAGVGTATAVCGDRVLAFGHPMLFSDRSRLAMHGASAVDIARDPTLGSYKLANIGAPDGRIVRDTIAAISGREGALPASTTVSSQLVGPYGVREGATTINLPGWLGYLGGYHLYANGLVVRGGDARGTAELSWRISGTREDGSPFAVTIDDKYASTYSIALPPAYALWNDLSAIQRNRFENVHIDRARIVGSYSRAFEAYRVSGLRVRQDGAWQDVGRRTTVAVRAGAVLNVRALLTRRDSDQVLRVPLSVTVPRRADGSRGYVSVVGGELRWWDGERNRASSFEDLLDQLANAQRNDEVQMSLHLSRRERGPNPSWSRDDQSQQDAVVSGYESFRVRVLAQR